ncbi:MAG TPA: hypothetical protein VGR62_18405 [Candidatus Binatia bacterium]|jgi:hypothetical protein|nr:hypothetical protein [Candidatus Binatia bacterium]
MIHLLALVMLLAPAGHWLATDAQAGALPPCVSGPAPACTGVCPAGSACGAVQGGAQCQCLPTSTLTVDKMSIKLNFAVPGKDSASFTAAIPVPAGFDPTGRSLSIDVGGIVRSFTLDAKGKAKTATEQVTLKLRRVGGTVPAQDALLSFKATKGTFATELADEGLTNANVDHEERTVSVGVLLNGGGGGGPVQKDVVAVYTAKTGKSGKFKK